MQRKVSTVTTHDIHMALLLHHLLDEGIVAKTVECFGFTQNDPQDGHTTFTVTYPIIEGTLD